MRHLIMHARAERVIAPFWWRDKWRVKGTAAGNLTIAGGATFVGTLLRPTADAFLPAPDPALRLRHLEFLTTTDGAI
jgi:hypothetical protein